MVAYTARKNPLAMPTGAPAPAPAYDVSADAYQPGAMRSAPNTPSPMAPSAGSPFTPPQGPPSNPLLAAAFDGFQRGFDPAGFEKRQATNKAAEGDKLKQTLALMQQQRALPEQQRGQWWQQNAPTISKIIGQDVSQMPLDVTKFTDQALDGQIAALSAQMGIGPVVSEAYTLAPGAQRYGADGRVVASNPGIEKTRAPIIIGNVAYDPETYQPVITGPEAAYTLSPDQVRMQGGQQIARGLSKPPESGINLTFGEGGAVSGLSIGGPSMSLGGTGTKGNEPAVIPGPNNEPRVALGEQALKSNKVYNSLQEYEAQNAVILEDVSRALGSASMWTTGLLGSALAAVPGTPQHDLANTLNTIKANIGFAKLEEMRLNSPTGGALGNVTERENTLLQSVLGAIEQSQSEKQFVYNLRRLETILADKEGRRRQAFARDYPDLAQFADFGRRTTTEVKRLSKDINQATAEYNALPSGASYIDDDGIQRTKK